jgi:DNA-binding transcriptional LysR family regulator
MFFSGQSRAVMDWRFMQDGTPVIVRPARTMLVDNSDILLSCGLAGLGMLQGIRAILAPHLESGRLVEVLTSYTTVTKPISVLYPDRRYLAPKVRVFIDWLSALFADKSAQLHGLLPPGKQ